MIQTAEYPTTKEERRIALEKAAIDAGYKNHEDKRDKCAKREGFSNWKHYQGVLIKRYEGRREERKRNRLYVFFARAGKIHPEKLEKYLCCGRF